MGDIVENQLRSCKIADLSNYDATERIYHIPKYAKPTYSTGKCYIVKLYPQVINNTRSILATNWNQGTAPTTEYLRIFVSGTLGVNIKVDACGYDFATQTDLDNFWSGWLSVNEMDQIKEI